VYFLCPETTGKTLEEIDVLFAKGDVPHEIMASGSSEGEGKEGLEFEHEEKVKA
jgi:hypothetical protein